MVIEWSVRSHRRHGQGHVSPEAAGLFSMIASLASMGLLLRVRAVVVSS